MALDTLCSLHCHDPTCHQHRRPPSDNTHSPPGEKLAQKLARSPAPTAHTYCSLSWRARPCGQEGRRLRDTYTCTHTHTGGRADRADRGNLSPQPSAEGRFPLIGYGVRIDETLHAALFVLFGVFLPRWGHRPLRQQNSLWSELDHLVANSDFPERSVSPREHAAVVRQHERVSGSSSDLWTMRALARSTNHLHDVLPLQMACNGRRVQQCGVRQVELVFTASSRHKRRPVAARTTETELPVLSTPAHQNL